MGISRVVKRAIPPIPFGGNKKTKTAISRDMRFGQKPIAIKFAAIHVDGMSAIVACLMLDE